jgi:large subunit ribosomal protein L19
MAEKEVITKPAGRALMTVVERPHLRKNIPEIRSGDTVRLQIRVVEGNRERLQPFEGVVMRLRGGGINRNFTVRRVTHGVGVERTFLLNSPRIEKIEVVRHARVRRKQLYYLRGLTGKAARLKEIRPTTAKEAAAKEAARLARAEAAATAASAAEAGDVVEETDSVEETTPIEGGDE